MNTHPPRALVPRREHDGRGLNDLWDWYASLVAAAQNHAPNGGGGNGSNNGNNGNANNNNPPRTTSTPKPSSPASTSRYTPPPTQNPTNAPAPAVTTTTTRPSSATTRATTDSSATPSETGTGSHSTIASAFTSPNNVGENPQGSGSLPTPSQTDSNGNPVPPYSGFDPRGTLTVAPPGIGSTASTDPTPSNKGLIAGLVIGLILLVALCALTVFFVMRRRRKQKREKEQTQTADDTWLVKTEEKEPAMVYEDEKRVSAPVSTTDPSISIAARTSRTSRFSKNSKTSRGSRPLSDQSYVTMMRARTPGGTPAIPIPYNPSEYSDDVSAHFTYFPQDDSVGVPVPYPLALHVPARVAQAMAERDEKWLAYEQQRGGRRRSSLLSYDTDATRPDLPRRSTLQSIPDTIDTDTSSIMERDTNGAYTVRQTKTQSSILDSSRSNMVNDGHDPSPHDVASSSAAPATAIRRLPPLPIPTTPPVVEQDENPFATEQDVHMVSTASPSRFVERDLSDDGTESGTVVQHGNITGVMRASPAALVSRFSAASVADEADFAPVASTSTGPGTMGFAPRNYRNPFADAYMAQPRSSGVARTVRESTVSDATGRSSAYSTYAGVLDHETLDGHGQAGNVTYKFPLPPQPRPS